MLPKAALQINVSADREEIEAFITALPENISANALLQALNCLYSREEVLSAVRSLQEQGGEIPDDDDAGGV